MRPAATGNYELRRPPILDNTAAATAQSTNQAAAERAASGGAGLFASRPASANFNPDGPVPSFGAGVFDQLAQMQSVVELSTTNLLNIISKTGSEEHKIKGVNP